MRAGTDTPVFAALLGEYAQRRLAAEAAAEAATTAADAARSAVEAATTHAARLRDRLADVEALHEPGAHGACPTCGSESPCPTLLLARGRIDLETAVAAVRDAVVPDVADDPADEGPPLPRMVDLLEEQRPGVERFFNALLGRTED